MSLSVILLLHSLSSIWFHPRSLGYLASGSWSPKQCQVCVPSFGIGPRSNQTLLGYSHKICTTTVLIYLAAKTSLSIKGSIAGSVSGYVAPT